MIIFDDNNKHVINLKNESVHGQPCKEELFHEINFFLAIAPPQGRVSVDNQRQKALSIDHQTGIKCPRNDWQRRNERDNQLAAITLQQVNQSSIVRSQIVTILDASGDKKRRKNAEIAKRLLRSG